MASKADEMVSETMQAEGGPPQKGSTAAKMQSAVDKQRVFEQSKQEMTMLYQEMINKNKQELDMPTEEMINKLHTQLRSITSKDASLMKSYEALTGQSQPPSDSIRAELQRLAAQNEGATKSSSSSATAGTTDPAAQSTIDRKQNFEQVADSVGQKMQSAPEQVTKEEGDLLHSREQRAFGETQKGGIASQAQQLAAENEGATKSSTNAAAGADPATQSTIDRQENFEQVAQSVGQKMEDAPGQVTKEEGDLMHSREQRAFGETQKGGIASQAQQLAAENEKK